MVTIIITVYKSNDGINYCCQVAYFSSNVLPIILIDSFLVILMLSHDNWLLAIALCYIERYESGINLLF